MMDYEFNAAIVWGTEWHVLGPFQIGTREAEWGSDPLERFGGFRNLSYDNIDDQPNNSKFRSSLTKDGIVTWSIAKLVGVGEGPLCGDSTRGTLEIAFDEVDWDALRSTYGWSGIQFQAWARGFLEIFPGTTSETETVTTVYIAGVGEFWIDGIQYFGGDFYGYRRAPVVLRLSPGKHVIDVRITHDIRGFGGGMPPRVVVDIEARLSKGGLVVVGDEVMMADVVDTRLAGKWASVPVRNEGVEWIEILGVLGLDGSKHSTELVEDDLPVRIAPGQTRPIRFKIRQLNFSLALKFRYRVENVGVDHWIKVKKKLQIVGHSHMPQKYTYLHPSGIVSHAILRPPSPNAKCPQDPANKLPILLALHGAGVEVSSNQSMSSYDALPDLCSWLLLPSGVTTWSGDDWHVWGFADVEAAVEAIPKWMKQVVWEEQGVDTKRWLVSGHSNGGQGTWYTLTHRNDRIIAAAPLSGYLSIPAYVPYQMWHEVDPWKSAIILASLNTYKHELLTENMVGTPIMQKHGQDDDNVPVFHSRRMAQLIVETGWETEYREISGRGHYWEGVMTDEGLTPFLEYYLQKAPLISRLPVKFSVVVANPADMGARGGIVVDQLEEPGRLGKIDVEISGSTWLIKALNIRRWHFDQPRSKSMPLPDRVIVDDSEEFPVGSGGNQTWFKSPEDGKWLASDSNWMLHEKHGRQWGALDAILNSRGRFSIVTPHGKKKELYHDAVALDISRNLYQYFAADTEILETPSSLATKNGNVILLDFPDDIGLQVDASPVGGFPISKFGNNILIRDAGGRTKSYALEPGMGIIYLHPLPRERLALVIWGVDEPGLRAAARLLPLRTGVGQPNFIVVGRESSWAGVAGVRAMGMFDYSWNTSRMSFF